MSNFYLLPSPNGTKNIFKSVTTSKNNHLLKGIRYMKVKSNFFSTTIPLFIFAALFSANIFAQALVTPNDIDIHNVKLGMSLNGVTTILGKPESKSNEVLGLQWKYVKPAINIYFDKKGKVTLISSKDPNVKIDVNGKTFKVSDSISDVKKILGEPYQEDKIGDSLELYYIDQGLTVTIYKGKVSNVMLTE